MQAESLFKGELFCSPALKKLLPQNDPVLAVPAHNHLPLPSSLFTTSHGVLAWPPAANQTRCGSASRVI